VGTSPAPSAPPIILPPEVVSLLPTPSRNPNINGAIITSNPSPTNKDGKKNNNKDDTDNHTFTNAKINYPIAAIGLIMISGAGCCAMIFALFAMKKTKKDKDRLAEVIEPDDVILGMHENEAFQG
jgi:hypothetical protein